MTIAKNTGKAILKACAKRISSNVPLVGSLIDVVDDIMRGQWEERREAVEKAFEEKFTSFDKKMEEILSKFETNPSNFAIFLNGMRGAMEDIDSEKIKFYVASAFNAIQKEKIDNVKIHLFLNFLRKYTILHLMALKYFSMEHGCKQPLTFQQQVNIEPRPPIDYVVSIIRETNPELISDIKLLNIIINDLNVDGMLKIARLEELDSSTIQKKSTPFGDEFLNFINADG